MGNTSVKAMDCNHCVFRELSCRFIPEGDFAALQKSTVQLNFKKGELVFKQGGKAQSFIFLHSGIVKFGYQYVTGDNYIMTVVRGPKLLGGANLFFKETNIFSITAMEDCDICMIDTRAFMKVAMKNPAYVLALCYDSVNMFQHSIFNFISLAHNQVNGRIANVLLYLWEHVYRDSEFDFTISRKEIAQFAACSHENVITTLSKFNRDGLVSLEGRKIIIRNIEGLNELSKKG